MKPSETDTGVAWIKQFKQSEQHIATELIDSIRIITRDDFINNLMSLIKECANNVNGNVGLYTERDIKGKNLFKEQKTKIGEKQILRAVGNGPCPVESHKKGKHEVGSEGIIANLITTLCREDEKKFSNHPGPDEIRSKKTRAFLIVTDIVGSGSRCYKYLTGAWKVKSIKSWHSKKILFFNVVSYTATERGRLYVTTHPSKPDIDFVIPCPTIYTEFDLEMRKKVKEFCMKNSPFKNKNLGFLGYQNTGALIIFPHGCPNNAPLLLHHKGKGHLEPLFKKGVTTSLTDAFIKKNQIEEIKDRLKALREKKLSHGNWLFRTNELGRKLVLFLAATKKKPNNELIIAQSTSLSIPEVRLLNVAIDFVPRGGKSLEKT